MNDLSIVALIISAVAAIVSAVTAFVTLRSAKRLNETIQSKHGNFAASSNIADPSLPPEPALDPNERDH